MVIQKASVTQSKLVAITAFDTRAFPHSSKCQQEASEMCAIVLLAWCIDLTSVLRYLDPEHAEHRHPPSLAEAFARGEGRRVM
jgi:hypothetical protein